VVNGIYSQSLYTVASDGRKPGVSVESGHWNEGIASAAEKKAFGLNIAIDPWGRKWLAQITPVAVKTPSRDITVSETLWWSHKC